METRKFEGEMRNELYLGGRIIMEDNKKIALSDKGDTQSFDISSSIHQTESFDNKSKKENSSEEQIYL